MAIGPQLPPHLQKRKRDGDVSDDSDDSRDTPPVNDSNDDSNAPKRARVVGPALPPAPIDQKPSNDPNDGDRDDSSDEEDYGPSLPAAETKEADAPQRIESRRLDAEVDKKTQGVQRDEWMMLPPTQDNLAARMDPTKLRARGFNTGKGAKGPGARDTDMSAWTETPEQRRKRLEDQVMGRKKDSEKPTTSALDQRKKLRNEQQAKQANDYNEKHRSRSMYDEHQAKAKTQQEDDPSRRAFDWEKDMGAGRLGGEQKREMLSKAADFGSRFSKGNYL